MPNRVATIGQLKASITPEVNQHHSGQSQRVSRSAFLSADPPEFCEVDDALSLIVKEGNRAGEVVPSEFVSHQEGKPARKDAVAIDDAILAVIVYQ